MRQPLQASFAFCDELAPGRARAARLAQPALRALDQSDLTPRPATRPRPVSIDLPRIGLPVEGGDREVARRALESRVATHIVDRRLILTITDNCYTMISVRRQKGQYRLRLHHMFLDADADIVRALGRYVARNDRAASRALGLYIEDHQRTIRYARRRAPRLVTLTTAGQVHELAAIYAELNRRYFGNAIDARITWGQRLPVGKRRPRRSIKMGSYSVEDRLIRIHPSLDRAFVPRLFVEWIVYHEMLHQKHDIPVVGGRRRFHTPAFMQEEASFAQHQVARRWERENLDRLLVY